MTPTRAAAYLGCATLLAAWLASAAGLGTPPPIRAPEPQPVPSTGTETLADDVQEQAVRLRERLAAAPAPRRPIRNPFAFAPRAAAPAARTAPAARSQPMVPPPVVAEPVLTLVGIAADRLPTGIARTAIITAESGEIFVVKAGEFIGGRYRVESVGADTVELTDLANASIRRLALR